MELQTAVPKDNWYVFRLRANCEESVLNKTREYLRGSAYTPFIPRRVRFIVRQQVVAAIVEHICFPGYLFVSAHDEPKKFMKEIAPVTRDVYGISELVHYGIDKYDIAVHERERDELSSMMDVNYCIGCSVGYFNEDKSVKIVAGALKGMESRIKKINRQKRFAIVDLPSFGSRREMRLALDFVEKSEREIES